MSRLCATLTLGAALGCAVVCAQAEPGTSHLDRVLASHSLRVCIWPDYYSITYRDPKTRVLSGIDVDLAKELAADLGPQIQVQFIDSSFAQLVDDVTHDRCDIAMFAVGITPERAQVLRFTQPYLKSDIYGITTRSNRRIKTWSDIDQPGVVVAVAKGTYHETVMAQKLRQASLVATATPFAREQEVESGRADIFMTDYPYSLRMLATTDWARLVKPPGTYHLTPYAYAMQPGDRRWFERVEQFMSTVKRDGRLMGVARRHHLEPIVDLN